MEKIVCIHTDGGCRNNQTEENIGGWGAVLEYGDYRKELSGNAINTTNNRMEMTALLSALKALKKDNLKIYVFSDSSYLMDCFRKRWYINWQKNGWITSAKKPVENKDLWEAILEQLKRQRSVEFFRVKGHVNLQSPSVNSDALYDKFVEWNGSAFSFEDFTHVVEMNNKADALANVAMDSL